MIFDTQYFGENKLKIEQVDPEILMSMFGSLLWNDHVEFREFIGITRNYNYPSIKYFSDFQKTTRHIQMPREMARKSIFVSSVYFQK